METDSTASQKILEKSHLKLIALSVVLLTVALFMRGGFTLQSFGLSHANGAAKPLTFAQAKADADKMLADEDTNAVVDPAQAEQTNEDLAQLDPSADAGSDAAVLGDSTGVDSSVDVDQVLNSDTVKSVPLIITDTSDEADLAAYASTVRKIEDQYGANVIIGALSGRDQASLDTAAKNYTAMVAALRTIKVPAPMEDYHRMKLVYYSSLAEMASSMGTDGPTDDGSSAASLFFSLNDRMSSMKSQLEAQYGIIL